MDNRTSSFMRGTASSGARRRTTSCNSLCASYSAGRSVGVPDNQSLPHRPHLNASRCPRCSRNWHPSRRPLPPSRVAPPPTCARNLLTWLSSTNLLRVAACRSVLSNAPSPEQSVVAAQRPMLGPPRGARPRRLHRLSARHLYRVA